MKPYKLKEQIEDATLYLGDSAYFLGLCNGSRIIRGADALVTDPPWGLGDLSGTTSKKRAKNNYESYDDTEQNIRLVVMPIIDEALRVCNGRGLIASGVRCMWEYPKPRAVGGFYQPAAVGMSPWGFAGYNPVLFYGKDPRDGRGQTSVMTTLTDRPDSNAHPCPKPIKAMNWMVNKASLEGETILDPFMGSGTTGVACANLGRKFIGIEIEEKYFDVACERIAAAYAQGRLFA